MTRVHERRTERERQAYFAARRRVDRAARALGQYVDWKDLDKWEDLCVENEDEPWAVPFFRVILEVKSMANHIACHERMQAKIDMEEIGRFDTSPPHMMMLED